MESTEPMTLGSPVGSSVHFSPQTHQATHSNAFLPGFLMGDTSITTTPVMSRSKSGVVGVGSRYISPNVSGMIPRQSPSDMPIVHSPKHSSFASAPVTAKEKAGSPPVQTLMDDLTRLDASQKSGTAHLLYRSSAYQAEMQHVSPNLSRRGIISDDLSPRRCKTPPSPGQTDPFYTQGEVITPRVELDDTWVTVFGFSTSSASFVLQRFSQLGNILSHHVASDGGNWMHIHYESSLQARKALSRNGKILPGNVMIGVVPCIDIKIISENILQNITSTQYQSPVQSNPSRTGTPVRSNKPGSIRPLTAAYNAASSDNKVVNEVRTPKKTSGLITTAMDYIFG